MAKFETVRGMRDFLPEDMIPRQYVFDKIRAVLESYGFSPWEAPALEYAELLGSKSVASEEIYKFKDKGGREVVLRPEKTQSIARIIATNPNISKPFKVYNIGRVWRYDRPQKGRFREFWQIDFDIFGTNKPIADAEIIACANACMNAIGLEDFKFKISNRKLANQLLLDVGIGEKNLPDALRAIDKMDKLGEEAVGQELKQKGVSTETIADLLELVRTKGKLSAIKKAFTIDKELLGELEEFESYLQDFGIENYSWDLSLVRGLSYYTGFVFEIDAGKGIGSVAGGGRYDKLIGQIAGQDIPATGIALGFERLMEILNIEKKKTNTQVFVVPIGTQAESIKILQQLRAKGIKADMDLLGRGVSNCFKYIDGMKIPYALIIGEKELKEKIFTLKDMKLGKESKVTLAQLFDKLKV